MSEKEIETISPEQYDALMGRLDEVKKSMDESKERDEEILKAYEVVSGKLEEFEKAAAEGNEKEGSGLTEEDVSKMIKEAVEAGEEKVEKKMMEVIEKIPFEKGFKGEGNGKGTESKKEEVGGLKMTLAKGYGMV